MVGYLTAITQSVFDIILSGWSTKNLDLIARAAGALSFGNVTGSVKISF
jgi:hypothetical protein